MRTRDRGTDRPALGTCPSCAVRIPSANLLIRYETTDGDSRMFAECPACEDPVHPE